MNGNERLRVTFGRDPEFEPLDIAAYFYSQIGERRDEKTGKILFGETPHPKSHLFPIEEEQSARLLSKCGYMSEDNLALVRSALALSLYAHQAQYRDSGEPYSTHALAVAIELAERYEQEGTLVASALLHDVKEDTPVTLDIVEKVTSREVRDTVYDLSKARGRYIRKDIADYKNRFQTLESLLKNPRVAIIRVFDKLHSLRTLATKKGEARRRTIIQEVLSFYAPLAKRVGLYDEARELEDLCLFHLSDKHKRIVAEIRAKRKEVMDQININLVLERIEKLTEVSQDYLCIREPNDYDVFRQMGEEAEVTVDHFYLNLDIALRQYPARPEVVYRRALEERLEFGRQALEVKSKLICQGDGFKLAGPVDEADFIKGLEDDLIDGLSFDIQGKFDGLPAFRLRVRVFPHDLWFLNRIPMTHLYYQRTTLPSDYSVDPFNEEEDKIARCHLVAEWKLSHLKEMYERAASAQVLRFIEPRTAAGFISVIGVDAQGREESLVMEKGVTVLDYAKFVFPPTWASIIAAEVNGKRASFNYVLQPRDKVHLKFRERGRKVYDPFWIYCFGIDTEGPTLVKEKIDEMLRRAKTEETIDSLMQEIIAVGVWRIEQELPLEPRMPSAFSLALKRALEKVEKKYPQYQKRGLLFHIGMGEVQEKIISEIAAGVLSAHHIDRDREVASSLPLAA